jgi:hypothetical protein
VQLRIRDFVDPALPLISGGFSTETVFFEESHSGVAGAWREVVQGRWPLTDRRGASVCGLSFSQ